MDRDNQDIWAGLLLMMSICGFLLIPSVSKISDTSTVVSLDTIIMALVIITAIASLTLAGTSLQYKIQNNQESTKTAIIIMLNITYLAFMLAMMYNYVVS